MCDKIIQFGICLTIAILFCVAVEAEPLAAPPLKCKVGDGECIKKATKLVLQMFAKGIPEYKIEPMDPMYMDKVDVSSQNLKLLVENLTITGTKDCDIEKLEIVGNRFEGQMECDLEMNGWYVMDGQLLVLPIKGEGKVYAKGNRVQFNGASELVEYTGKDGKIHWKIKTFTHSYKLNAKPKLVFENLFNGNEVLKKGVEDLIEKNPEELIYIVGDKALNAVSLRTIGNVNHYFKALPVEELILKD